MDLDDLESWIYGSWTKGVNNEREPGNLVNKLDESGVNGIKLVEVFGTHENKGINVLESRPKTIWRRNPA